MASLKDQGRYASFSVSSSSVTKVFGWMFYGLLLTFGTALGLYLSAGYGVISADAYLTVLAVSAMSYLVFSFIAIFVMARTQNKTTSIIIYSIYALLLGIVLSSIFITTDISDVVYALGTTSLVFGIMALYGYFTKRDLTGFASILTMLLIGIIVMSFVNFLLSFFLGSAAFTMMDWIFSYAVLGIIIGYVAFDVQRIKHAAEAGALCNSLPIYLAFNLYTDFVYIFIRIVAIISSRRD